MDPIRQCALYKQEGCVHIDGFLCNVETCTMLQEFIQGEGEFSINKTPHLVWRYDENTHQRKEKARH